MNTTSTGETSDPNTSLSIGQFAAAVGLSVSAVRFYANRGLLIPADVDPQSGYRRFDLAQVAHGQLIRDLRRLDMPLATITDALGASEDERKALIRDHLADLTASVDRVRTLAQSLGAADRTAADAPSQDTTMSSHEPPTHEPPSTEHATNDGSVTLPARTLGAGLAQVLPVAGTDATTPHLMTVLVEAKDGSLRLVATDRHRLAVRDLVPTAIGSEFTAVVASATMATWQERLDVDGDVTIQSTASAISLSGEVTAEATPVPATYPDYQSVLDTPKGTTTVTARHHDLRAVLADLTEPVLMDFASTGTAVDTTVIDSTHSGPDQQVLLDPAYVRDALDATVGPEVVIDIIDPLRPIVIRSADDGTFTTLLMPIAPE